MAYVALIQFQGAVFFFSGEVVYVVLTLVYSTDSSLRVQVCISSSVVNLSCYLRKLVV